jgi:hypothetical protein
MDLYCQRCGEPWEMSGLWDFEIDDYKGARKDFLDGIGCPPCKWGLKEIKDKPRISEFAQIAREELGDDIDGIAASLEDLEYMGFLDEELYGEA